MDFMDGAQDALHCDLCETADLQSHCELCAVKLCKTCVGEHLSDSSKIHQVVAYKQKRTIPNYPVCPKHAKKHCELFCEKCGIPVCSTCISSGKHKGHSLLDILQKLCSKKEDMKKDLKELEKRIHPKYEEIAQDIKSEKASVEKHYRKLVTAVNRRGEEWHREVDTLVDKQKSAIEEMKNEQLVILHKQKHEIIQTTSLVKQSILDLKTILDSNDVLLTSEYKSRNAEFRRPPARDRLSLPMFSPQKMDKKQLYQLFGSLTALPIQTEEHGHAMKTTEALYSSPSIKPLPEEPELIHTIDTMSDRLRSVTCLSDEEIWTCGNDKIMKLFNLQNKLLMSIQTKSGNISYDIAVTRGGGLVYTDHTARTVNVVRKDRTQEVIRLQRWIPYNICSTSSDDLLVTMVGDDKQSRVVRYTGSTEKQIIQFDENTTPLYSSYHLKYISENRNLDICVVDYGAHAVVVVSQAGKFRFRYTGHAPPTNKSFNPYGITTDSQSRILITDWDKNCIHIIDEDGGFLRYIDNCDLSCPCGLCVATTDNLFVTECYKGRVKIIKYKHTLLKLQ